MGVFCCKTDRDSILMVDLVDVGVEVLPVEESVGQVEEEVFN